jgi:hypothetical protein
MTTTHYDIVRRPFDMTAIPSPSQPVPHDSKAFERSQGRKWRPKKGK